MPNNFFILESISLEMKKYNLKYVIMNQTMYANVCIYIKCM